MKHDVYYSLRRQNIWITLSGALMGLSFLIQAIYYLLVRSIVEVHIAELVIFMIVPMTIEFLWCLLIHVFPFKSTVPLSICACLVFLMLITYTVFYDNLVRTIIAAASYLAISQLVFVILSGLFPYKLFGFVGMLTVLCGRVLLFTYPVYIRVGAWEQLILRELPGVCMVAAVWCVFGCLEPHKKVKKEESTEIQ